MLTSISAKPFLARCAFSAASASCGGHVGHEAHVDFRDGFAGQNGFAAWAGVATDQAFDVNRRRDIAVRAILASSRRGPSDRRPLLFLASASLRRCAATCDHFFVGVRKRARLGGETFDDGIVAVGRNERRERFDEMPRGTVDASFVAGVQIFLRAAAPTFAARNQFEFDDAFRAESTSSPCRRVAATRTACRRRCIFSERRRLRACERLAENAASRFLLRLRQRKQNLRAFSFLRRAWRAARRGTSLRGLSDLRRRGRRRLCRGRACRPDAASNGGELHSAGSACFTSYMK